jgi:hypothetical protein
MPLFLSHPHRIAMKARVILLTILTALGLTGCGSESPTETSALKEAFPKEKAVTPEAREVQSLAEKAADAAAKGDMEQAVASLLVLQAEQNLNPAQRAAVQDQMSNVQSDLANRADAGDANAKRALDAIRAMKSRR